MHEENARRADSVPLTVFRGPPQKERDALSNSNIRVTLAIRLIHQQYQHTGLTLAHFASQLNISVWHLARIFKKETGESLKQHLRAVRMTKAKELLVVTTCSIKEIAASVGYNHVSDFDHHFKAAVHMRPGEYRILMLKVESREQELPINTG